MGDPHAVRARIRRLTTQKARPLVPASTQTGPGRTRKGTTQTMRNQRNTRGVGDMFAELDRILPPRGHYALDAIPELEHFRVSVQLPGAYRAHEAARPVDGYDTCVLAAEGRTLADALAEALLTLRAVLGVTLEVAA